MTPTLLARTGLPPTSLALRVALFLLPCAALAVALPARPHVLVLAVVVLCSARWAHTPDHLAGTVALATVVLWWAAHGVMDWRVPVVGALLVVAHVVATLLSYGPAVLPVDGRLATVWLRRAVLTLVPLPVTWVALRGLDASLAPDWVWISAALLTVAMVMVTLRLTQPVDE